MTNEIERRIPLEGCVNFRDLGGYSAAGGRTVKWRCLFRSDSPNSLTEADVQTITEDLGVLSIVDLRSSSGVADDGRGLLALSGIGYHNFPLLERRGFLPPTSGAEVEERLTDMYQWILFNAGALMAQAFDPAWASQPRLARRDEPAMNRI